ncbi:alpha/beta hydrolase [Mesobacillus zeae]|uniref:Alpha/beta hydrolase n=1 Tax=Mesobacillus zeae TaxID=1917180 RepID=A0A398AWI7_9BACI|nr:alpha/beta hydrolase [Mesobacillus zeae]RID81961.1 alpha/beta hydrolase [Mesobacillus zeae]
MVKIRNCIVRMRDNITEVKYTHIETGADTICFMFSGASYTYDRPLFYYSTMAMLQLNVDIVQVHYSFEQDLLKKSLDDITRNIMNAIHPVLNEVQENGQYNETIFIGKSLGTIPIVNELMKREVFREAKVILFTPLLKLEQFLESLLKSNHQGLLVIGDKDHYYHSNQLERLKQTQLTIEVVPNANHSLDIEGFDTEESIAVIARIMEKLKEAVNGGGD